MTAYDYLSEMVLTVDTREQDDKRIQSISEFFKARGAMINKHKLEHVDYLIEGFFANKEVQLGIEFKRGDDFAGSFDGLNNRLALACDLYENVALILHHNHDGIMDIAYETHEKSVYKYVVTDTMTLHTPYNMLHNTLRTFEREGILTGQISSVWEFPRMAVSMLYYAIADSHTGLCLDKDNAKYELRNVLMKVPGIGPHVSKKLADRYDNILEIVDAEDIDECIGNKKAEKLLRFLGVQYND